MTKLDLLLCIVPKVNPYAPTVGPALLKSYVQNAGYTCKVLDLNVDLFLECQKNGDEKFFFEEDKVFKHIAISGTQGYEEFEEFYEKYEYVFLRWIEQFKEVNPKYLGLSLLTFYSRAVALKLSALVKEKLPSVQIIWGGPDVGQHTNRLRRQGIVDHFISGDGEIALVQLLRGNLNVIGINKGEVNQVTDLSGSPVPDYDDIDWNSYPNWYGNDSPIYITGSRGCVKKCKFCNVPALWPKFTFRDADDIVNEMIILHKKYNRRTFKFTDSLINGSIKNFNRLLVALKNVRESGIDIQWSSQWICRPKNQMPEESFLLLQESGCVELEIGVESFSEPVRFHMGKKFTNEDMWYCFEMLNKYKINHTVLMFVGYPTETDSDHQCNLDTITKLSELGYLKTSHSGYSKVQFNNTLILDESTEVWNIVKDELTNYQNKFQWDYKDNTFEKRLQRLKEVNELLKQFDDQLSRMTVRTLQQLEKL